MIVVIHKSSLGTYGMHSLLSFDSIRFDSIRFHSIRFDSIQLDFVYQCNHGFAAQVLLIILVLAQLRSLGGVRFGGDASVNFLRHHTAA